MEMKSNTQAAHLPSDPPPYTPPETSVNPAVVQTVPPTFNSHGTNAVHNTSVIQVQPTVVTSNFVIPNAMGPIATPYICPSCNQMIVTKVEASTTMKQHVCAALLCVFGFWPCAFIPYCMPSCRKADHSCPICNSYIGTYLSYRS